jgi:hypothetical protein
MNKIFYVSLALLITAATVQAGEKSKNSSSESYDYDEIALDPKFKAIVAESLERTKKDHGAIVTKHLEEMQKAVEQTHRQSSTIDDKEESSDEEEQFKDLHLYEPNDDEDQSTKQSIASTPAPVVLAVPVATLGVVSNSSTPVHVAELSPIAPIQKAKQKEKLHQPIEQLGPI